MAQIIYKYPLKSKIVQITMPVNAKPLCVQAQDETPMLWVLFDPNEKMMQDRQYISYMTGFDMPDNPGQYIGTVQIDNGSYVLHVFEVMV